MRSPEITVALPVWNGRPIAWLFMESISRQVAPCTEWELLICEEQYDNKCGYSYFEPYISRLNKIGGSIRYLPIPDKMSLPNKWRYIAHKAADTSRVYHMCATDNYYQPNMLIETWNAIGAGADWFQSYRCHFYDIDTGKFVAYKNKKLSGIEMAMRTDLAKKIRPSEKKRVIDLHVLRSAKPQNLEWNESGSWIGTVCTHGRNNISGDRRKRLLNEEQPPFCHTDHQMKDVLPDDIYERIMKL